MNPEHKAREISQRLFAGAKAAAESRAVSVIDSPTAKANRPTLGNHAEQYRHYRGWQYVAIRAIAQRVAGQCVCVGRMGKQSHSRSKLHDVKQVLPMSLKNLGESIEPLEMHPMLEALATPNPLMVAWVLWYVTVASLEITGRAYIWIRDNGERFEFWPLPSHWVEPLHEGKMFSGWRVRPDGATDHIDLDADEVVLIALPDPGNPYLGTVSPLQSQARAINADESIQEAQDKAFQGVLPKMALRVGGLPDVQGITRPNQNLPALTANQRKQLLDSVKKAYAGVANAGEPCLILDNLIADVFPLSQKPSEMDFLDSGKQTKSRIMQAFGVNPIIVGEIENANRAQAFVADKSFVSNVINPLLELMSQVLTARVAPLFANERERLLVWFVEAQAVDEEMRQQKWETAVNKGLCTVNEYRAFMDLPPIEGGDMLVGTADSFADMIESQVSRAMGNFAASGAFGR